MREFLTALGAEDRATVYDRMKTIQRHGIAEARHVRGDMYEVRAAGNREAFPILFASEGQHSQVLLALEGFSKKTQKTPPTTIDLAEQRLKDWRSRANQPRE